MRRLTLPPVLLGLVCTAFVTACSAAATPGPSVLGADFHDKVVAACSKAVATHVAMGTFPLTDFNPTKPDVAKLPAIVDILQKDADRYATLVDDLTALGTPPAGATLWTAVLDAVKLHASSSAEQATAAATGDTATFTKDFNEGAAATTAFLAAITAAGIPECGPVDRTAPGVSPE